MKKKQVRPSADVNAKLRLARAAFTVGSLTKAASILEQIAKDDKGFVLVCDRLLQVYRAMTLERGRQSNKDLQKKIDQVERQRDELEAEYQFPSPFASGPNANFSKDIFFKTRGFAVKGLMHGPFATIGTKFPVAFGNSTLPWVQDVALKPHIETEVGDEAADIVVTVFLDQSDFRKGETGLSVLATPGTILQAHISTSDHFAIEGLSHRSFAVQLSTRTIVFPSFSLKKTANAETKPGQPFICAFFTVEGEFRGTVTRAVDLDGRPLSNRSFGEAVNLFAETGKLADLSVLVTQTGEGYSCHVMSPHLEDFRNGKSMTWQLHGNSEDIVTGYMERFTAPNTKPRQLIAELRGAGKMLFNATPEVFRQAYWQLVNDKLPLDTIAVVSQEPFIPWELMVPTEGPNGEDHNLPLGAQYSVGRWVHSAVAPTSVLAVSESQIVAPQYDAERTLPQSQPEAAAVIATIGGRVVTPASFEDVSAALISQSSLLHFVCHGEDEGTSGQALLLDDNDVLTESSLLGIDGVKAAFKAKAPLVFLNACEVGRGSPSLVGERSFASQFIKLGAQAVIAPLWSVDDTIAHEVALAFYGALKDTPGKPLAEIFRDIRKKAYETGQDTWAAYCFFGNPSAVAVY